MGLATSKGRKGEGGQRLGKGGKGKEKGQGMEKGYGLPREGRGA